VGGGAGRSGGVKESTGKVDIPVIIREIIDSIGSRWRLDVSGLMEAEDDQGKRQRSKGQDIHHNPCTDRTSCMSVSIPTSLQE
jgi:hypothetical protein